MNVTIMLTGLVGGASLVAAYSVSTDDDKAVRSTKDVLAASSQASDVDGDLSHGRQLLQPVRDNVFSFDDPGFYWFCRYVRRHPPADAAATATPVAWSALLERPSDYRGQTVVIEGILQARTAFDVSNRPGIDRLYQCEISSPETRALGTIVCLSDPSEILIHSRVRANAYFIKSRAFRTNAGQDGAGPLLVASRLILAQSPAMPGDRTVLSRSISTWLGASIAGLAIFWVVLRRMTARPTRTRPRMPGPDGTSSSDDFDWLIGPGGGDSNAGRN